MSNFNTLETVYLNEKDFNSIKPLETFPNPRVIRGIWKGKEMRVQFACEITYEKVVRKEQADWHNVPLGSYFVNAWAGHFPTDLIANTVNRRYSSDTELGRKTGYIATASNLGTATDCVTNIEATLAILAKNNFIVLGENTPELEEQSREKYYPKPIYNSEPEVKKEKKEKNGKSPKKDTPPIKQGLITENVTVSGKPNGEKLTIEVSGETYPHREFIKSNSLKWNGKEKKWFTYYGSTAQFEALRAYFDSEDVNTPQAGISSPQKPEIKPVDNNKKLAEQWRKVAESCQKKSDDLNDRLSSKSTHTHKMQREYNSARQTQENWEEIAKFQAAIAKVYENGTANEMLLKLKPMVGKEYYENSLYPFCRYRNSSPYGSQKNINYNFENIKPQNFTVEEVIEMLNYLEEITGKVVIDPKQKELEKLIQDVKFGKIVGFFPTPQKVIEKMMQLADIQIKELILEPSAGIGSIADEIKKQVPNGIDYLTCVEQNYSLAKILTLKGYNVKNEDFMKFERKSLFHKILMNPPFENGQDAEHIKHAFDLLYPGGRIVAIAGEGIFFRSDKKSVAFREFVDEYGYSEKLPDDSFNGKDSFRKTGVATRIVVIDKPDVGSVKVETQEKPKREFDGRIVESLVKECNEDIQSKKIGYFSVEKVWEYVLEGVFPTMDDELECLENAMEGLRLMFLQAGIKPKNIDTFMAIFMNQMRKRHNQTDYCYFFLKHEFLKLEL